jgi:hypothetical protein
VLTLVTTLQLPPKRCWTPVPTHQVLRPASVVEDREKKKRELYFIVDHALLAVKGHRLPVNLFIFT